MTEAPRQREDVLRARYPMNANCTFFQLDGAQLAPALLILFTHS